MLKTIKISPYNDSVVHPGVKRSIAVALLTALFSSPILAVWAAPCENADIAPYVNLSEDLVWHEITDESVVRVRPRPKTDP